MASKRKAELIYQIRKALLNLGRALAIAQLDKDFEAQHDIKKSISYLAKRLKVLSQENKK